ncbi:hypothetical protein FQN60_016147, partial [Etheostoma spectabile]
MVLVGRGEGLRWARKQHRRDLFLMLVVRLFWTGVGTFTVATCVSVSAKMLPISALKFASTPNEDKLPPDRMKSNSQPE